MISREEMMKIKIMQNQGYSQRTIAEELGTSRRTVMKYLYSDIDEASYSRRPNVKSKLDNYKPYLHSRIAKAVPIHLSGKIVAMASGKPLRPSTKVMRISFTPRLLSSVNTESQ